MGDSVNNPDYMAYNEGTTNHFVVNRRTSNEGYAVKIPNVINGYYYNHYAINYHGNGEISVYINGID